MGDIESGELDYGWPPSKGLVVFTPEEVDERYPMGPPDQSVESDPLDFDGPSPSS